MFDYGNPKDTHWMLNTNATEKPDYWRPKCKSIRTFLLWKQIDGISTTFPIERLSQHKYVFSIICLFFEIVKHFSVKIHIDNKKKSTTNILMPKNKRCLCRYVRDLTFNNLYFFVCAKSYSFACGWLMELAVLGRTRSWPNFKQSYYILFLHSLQFKIFSGFLV